MSAEPLRAAVFDVDGVLLASQHGRAWRDAQASLIDPVRYEATVAGKRWMNGALAAAKALGVSVGEGHVAVAYADRMQDRLEALIAGGTSLHSPTGLRVVTAVSFRMARPCAFAANGRFASLMRRSQFTSSRSTRPRLARRSTNWTMPGQPRTRSPAASNQLSVSTHQGNQPSQIRA